MKGWVGLGGWLHTETVTHLSTNRARRRVTLLPLRHAATIHRPPFARDPSRNHVLRYTTLIGNKTRTIRLTRLMPHVKQINAIASCWYRGKAKASINLDECWFSRTDLWASLRWIYLDDGKVDKVIKQMVKVKAKFHYASWFGAGSEPVRS